jgi:hypothetical protein
MSDVNDGVMEDPAAMAARLAPPSGQGRDAAREAAFTERAAELQTLAGNAALAEFASAWLKRRAIVFGEAPLTMTEAAELRQLVSMADRMAAAQGAEALRQLRQAG